MLVSQEDGAHVSEYMQVVFAQESKFNSINKANGDLLNFRNECIFAKQQIIRNDFTTKVAKKNPASLRDAILNVSSIGISLNPVYQHAYLVPRDGAIRLVISYKGLLKLATDSNSIKWAKAELVYENDEFEYKGPVTAPIHHANVFGDRGKFIGGYCIAGLPDDTKMIDIMTEADITKVRSMSSAFKKNSGPWVTWLDEMRKKTIIKRAQKTWPQSSRLDKAVAVINQHEGSAFTLGQHERFMHLLNSNDSMGFHLFFTQLDEKTQSALFNSFEKGQISKNKDKIRELEIRASEKITEWAFDLLSCREAGDEEGGKEILDCEPALKTMILSAAGLNDE